MYAEFFSRSPKRQSPWIVVRAALVAFVVCVVLPACGGEEQPAKKTASEKPSAAAEPKKETPKNRLAKETSPYLLLHAHNPVDWFPWGEEALAKAKQENKLIFLSIGYSSCHWCHVMERESFLDDEIAAFLNKHYVCIKVDREERPDVDTIYMTSLRVFNQLTRSGRGGGWPLSMVLTPDAEPFYGGTYFPARDGDRGATTGFITIMRRIQEVWEADAEKIKEDSKTITKFVKAELENQRPAVLAKLDAMLLDGVQTALNDQFDAKFGGFGFVEADPRRPKFPEPSNLLFVLDRVRRLRAAGQDDAEPLGQLVTSLERMSMGGIRDHLGGGFHRYSVDRFWHIPHFEKMLYDNGQLATIYTEAFLLTEREDFRRVVDELLTFVLRELTDERGGFYSALDAESEGDEGKFYRWEKDELEKLLTKDEFAVFAAAYGIQDEPNFDEKYFVPQFAKPFADIAAAHKTNDTALEKQLAPIRTKLLAARATRPRPLTDTKVLTSWNGLMIRGFSDAGRGLKNPRYIAAATKAADFALTQLRAPDGRLRRTFGQGEAKLNAYVDDYAFLVDGLIALHKATGEEKWLRAADELTAKQIELFWDERRGGCFFTSGDHESLLARAKDFTDGAEPSGNSVSADNLVYLARALKKPDYRKQAEQTIHSASSLLQNAPSAVPRLAVALAALLDEK